MNPMKQASSLFFFLKKITSLCLLQQSNIIILIFEGHSSKKKIKLSMVFLYILYFVYQTDRFLLFNFNAISIYTNIKIFFFLFLPSCCVGIRGDEKFSIANYS